VRALVVLLSCATAPPSPMTPPSQIDWLLGLGRALLQHEAAEPLAHRLGTVTIDLPPRLVVDAPDLEITVDREDGKARALSLVPRKPTALPSLTELESRLGKPIEGVRTHPMAPLSYIFRVDLDKASDRTCTVVVYMSGSALSRIAVFTEPRI
jgi:hypothetical protein